MAAVSVVTPSVACYAYSIRDKPFGDGLSVRKLFGQTAVLCSNGIGTGDDSSIIHTSFYSKYTTWDDNWDRREPVGTDRDPKDSGPTDSSGADTFEKKSEKVEKHTIH